MQLFALPKRTSCFGNIKIPGRGQPANIPAPRPCSDALHGDTSGGVSTSSRSSRFNRTSPRAPPLPQTLSASIPRSGQVCSEVPSTAPPRDTKGRLKVYPRVWNCPRWVGASHICPALPIRTHTLPSLLLCVMKTLGRLKVWMRRSADGVRSSPSGGRRSLRRAAVSSRPALPQRRMTLNSASSSGFDQLHPINSLRHSGDHGLFRKAAR